MGGLFRSKSEGPKPKPNAAGPATRPSPILRHGSAHGGTNFNSNSQFNDYGIDDRTPTQSLRKWLCSCVSIDMPRTVAYFQKVLKSRIGKGLMVCFSIFLLFGSPIQHLLMPPAADVVFDILSCITLGYFVVDMVIRIVAEPNYFHFQVWLPPGMTKNRGNVYITEPTPVLECAMGSFMFWCDIVSAGMLLYDISFINPDHYSVVDVDIRLDKHGLAVRRRSFWNTSREDVRSIYY
jgi:hypothetical protein